MSSKFTICSSKATAAGGEGEVKALQADTNLDNFLTLLTSQALLFSSTPNSPNEEIELDPSDSLSKWIKFFDPQGKFSVTFDDAASRTILAFHFQLAAPRWELAFSSSSSALLDAFGTLVEGQEVPKVPAPGLNTDGRLLHFGLDMHRSKDVTTTVQGLFDFAEIPASTPPGLATWEVSLVVADAKQKHNALWYSPLNYDQSIIRLQFSLGGDNQSKFQEYIGSVLPSFTFKGVDFICRKVLTSAMSGDETFASATGEVLIQAGCTISPGGHELDITTGITFSGGQYDLNLRFDKQVQGKDALHIVLLWLADCAGGNKDFGSILYLIAQEEGKLFGDIFDLRQIRMSLAASEEGKGARLLSFSIDIEAKATFGSASVTDPVVFLLNYSWTRGGPKLGTIRGDLWNTFDDSPTCDLAPGYENMRHLVPNTKPVAKAISIPNMFPDVTIQNIPKSIPTEITRAYIMINQNSIAIGGTVESVAFRSKETYPVPQLDLGYISLDGSYDWSTKDLRVQAGMMVELKPAEHARHQETAMLTGNVEYDSKTCKWILKAELESLYLSSLYHFFSHKAEGGGDDAAIGDGDHVLPLIETIEMESMSLMYMYEKPPPGAGGGGEDVVGSSFAFRGIVNVSDLQLSLEFKSDNAGWNFSAGLHAGKETSIGKIIEALAGETVDIPEFLHDAKLDPANRDGIDIVMQKSTPTKAGSAGVFQFVAKLKIHPHKDVEVELIFAQWHGEDWPAAEPSKRLVKVALTDIRIPTVPLVGDMTQPFDEMYFMYVMDGTKQNKGMLPGITRKEKTDLNLNTNFGAHPLVAKDENKEDAGDEAVIFSAGSHFVIVLRQPDGSRTCVLDYDFRKRQTPQKEDTTPGATIAAGSVPKHKSEDQGKAVVVSKPGSDGISKSAPLKKKMGPLSISNIGLEYADGMLHISLDATMELGPIALSLLGFGLRIKITSLDLSQIETPQLSLEGFSIAFEQKPLTIAGIIRQGLGSSLDSYAGGLILGWTPYQLQAAGFYGKVDPGQGANPFTSVFVFARLNGPLMTVGYAEISGVTGGFGYHSSIRTPTADQITSFPFISQDELDSADDAMHVLQKLVDPTKDGWFKDSLGSYWAAAGMKVNAFQMISLDAVVVVQLGQSIKLGIFGVALVDIPNALSKLKFAHVELGIAVVVDLDLGVIKVEAQLSPKSFILHPSCKLTGGFALYYWFDAPHADRENIGNFVFSLGGYHPAFEVPLGWPVPDRLGIAWSLGRNLSITGEAFFAITPKVCMGGGRLRASYSAGPIEAWFDAFANFLIQYQPFHFNAEIRVTVGVSFNLDVGIIHIHISPEIGADLLLWGPPLAGKVYVDLWVHKFTIHFGDSGGSSTGPLNLGQFFELVLQAGSKHKTVEAQGSSSTTELVVKKDIELLTNEAKTGKFNRKADNAAHTFLAQSGLLNDNASPTRQPNDPWVVRGGTFSFVVGCKMVIDDAKLIEENSEPEKKLDSVSSGTGQVFAKPMKITTALNSNLTIGITHARDTQVWGMSEEYTSVPSGLWQQYSKSQDPGEGDNNIDELLDDKDGSMRRMTGVLFTAPIPKKPDDKLKVLDIADSMRQEIQASKQFPLPERYHDDWDPVPPTDAQGSDAWAVIKTRWQTPTWNTDEASQVGKEPVGAEAADVQTTAVQAWVEALQWDKELNLASMAKMPKYLEYRFHQIYASVPMMTR